MAGMLINYAAHVHVYSYMLFDTLIVWTFEGHEPQDLRDNISLSTPVTTCVHDNAEQAEQICSVIKKTPNKSLCVNRKHRSD